MDGSLLSAVPTARGTGPELTTHEYMILRAPEMIYLHRPECWLEHALCSPVKQTCLRGSSQAVTAHTCWLRESNHTEHPLQSTRPSARCIGSHAAGFDVEVCRFHPLGFRRV